MSDEAHGSGSSAGSIFSDFFGHLFGMPRWHKLLLILGALVGGAGITGKTMEMVGGETAGARVEARSADGTTPHASVVGDTASPVGDSGAGSQSREESIQSWLIHNAPWLTRIGLGFVGGFIIGWIFRAFIKLMTMITLAGVVIFAALSYFHVVNVDLSDARQKYESAAAWVTDQGNKLKDAALAHIPAGMSSFGGMFVGFLRKK